METCEVLVVGGGPAGSTCAGMLRQAGLDVMLIDKKNFPRQKTCAGWITPAVLDTVGVDSEEYRQGRVLQDINSFSTGLMNGTPVVTRFGSTVSYGIRRCEFDHFLLQRSGVRRHLGEAAVSLCRKDGWWQVNGYIRARMLVGAGGHFCTVARLLGAEIGREEVVVAQAAECAMSHDEEKSCSIRPETPALFFCSDMKGYGWLFRKENYLNFGLGRRDTGNLVRHTKDFLAFLSQRGDIPSSFDGKMKGHPYLLYGGTKRRTCVGDGALLIGDAAGVAHSQSGEGILPSIESALLAAETILTAGGDYRRDNLESYSALLDHHLGNSNCCSSSLPVFSRFSRFLGSRLLSSSWCSRHVVLDRWFLHTGRKRVNAGR